MIDHDTTEELSAATQTAVTIRARCNRARSSRTAFDVIRPTGTLRIEQGNRAVTMTESEAEKLTEILLEAYDEQD